MTDDMMQVQTAKATTIDGPLDGDDLCAPYTFVPINRTILTVDSPSHARPEKGNLSGTLSIQLTNETPLLVGGSNGENNLPFRIGESYMLPGASIRGMLRSVVEIGSFSRVSFVDEHPAAIRDFDAITWKTLTDGLIKWTKGAYAIKPRAGWLFRVTQKHGEMRKHVYYLVEASSVKPVQLEQLVPLASGCTSIKDWHLMTLHERFVALGKMTGLNPEHLYGLDDMAEGSAQLFISGRSPTKTKADGVEELITNKEREYLASWPDKPTSIQINTTIAQNFLGSLSRDSSRSGTAPNSNITAIEHHLLKDNFGCGPLDQQLEQPSTHGIPVFFHLPSGTPPSHPVLSLTAAFRAPYRNNLRQVLDRTQPETDATRTRLDLTQALFGWVPPEIEEANSHDRGARNQSWRGRVRFGFATHEGSGTTQKRSLPGISPRPSFHPFYLRPGTENATHPVDFDNPAAIVSGRKRYPARNGTTPAPTIEGNAQNVEVTFLDPGQDFTAEIRLHNARPYEVGALLWAISLGQLPQNAKAAGPLPEAPDQQLRHMLGRGRNWGHGQMKVTLKSAHLTTVDDDQTPTLNALVKTFKEWVKTGLTAAGEEVTDFDEREEIQRLLGTCYAPYGAEAGDRLQYTGQPADGDSEAILQAHVRIKKASMADRSVKRFAALPKQSPSASGERGFIGLPPWPRFSLRDPETDSE